jgi:hypothetical protein
MTSIEEIEQIIKPFLLTEVTFYLEDKKIKAGKLILFSIRDFFCIFTLADSVKNKRIIYEIPYPFSITSEDSKMIFDYTEETFCENNKEIQRVFKTLLPKKQSKLFNKKLVVSSRY